MFRRWGCSLGLNGYKLGLSRPPSHNTRRHLRRGTWRHPGRTPSGYRLEYPAHYVVKKRTTGGTFRIGSNRLLYLANAMVDQHIGLEETDDGVWAIHFNNILRATFDERDYISTG